MTLSFPSGITSRAIPIVLKGSATDLKAAALFALICIAKAFGQLADIPVAAATVAAEGVM